MLKHQLHIRPSEYLLVPKREISKMSNPNSKSNEVLVNEVSIPVPWGHLAGKWWGPKDIRPIVCIHGWQDNAGTFDRLIPLLPKDLSYLAIDLPGHGLSSWLPDGLLYSGIHNIYVLQYLIEHYKWNKIALMGHSMGGITSFYYSSVFADSCDFVIGIDGLFPFPWKFELEVKALEVCLREGLKVDIRNQSKSEPPAYSYEKTISLLSGPEGFMSVSRQGAECLFKRSAKPLASDGNLFQIGRDSKIKHILPIVYKMEQSKHLASRISHPYCFFRSTQDPDTHRRKEKVDELLDNFQKENTNFELHRYDGNHYVHLNEPHLIGGIITNFLNKYHYLRKLVSHL